MSNMRQEPVFEIHGKHFPAASIWIHHQRNPFPGGHVYRLDLPKGVAAVWEERLGHKIVNLESVKYEFSRLGLYWLESALSGFMNRPDAEEMKTKYVVNTISRVVVGDDSVSVFGVCSPFVQPKGALALETGVRVEPQQEVTYQYGPEPMNRAGR